MRKRIGKILLILFFTLLLMELILRCGLGFCDALLYQASDKYEYIAKSNQDRFRFGARIRYNSYSQRSEEPDTIKKRILGIGDSVIFGGTWMDQDSLATTLFTKETGVQMLNISAGSWGPDNCAAYLRDRGVFGAKAIILVCSSHDAYDCMSFTPVVGKYPTYPEQQYKFAICELLERYMWPYIKKIVIQAKLQLDPDAQTIAMHRRGVVKKTAFFNVGFDELLHIADSVKIPFAIYLHAEQGEIEAGRYNEMGQEIISWAKQKNVFLLQGIKTEQKEMYRDVIHFNTLGQRHLADCLEEMYCSFK